MNFQGIICGPPGFGKTTLAASLVRKHLTETRGIVLAFDPFSQFAKHGCYSYKDANAYRVAAEQKRAEGKEMPRGASLGGKASDVTALAIELGQKLNSAHDVRVPILVPYDEGSLIDSSGSTYIGDLDNQTQAARRHFGVALLYNVQQPSQLMERFWTMSTNVFLFRQTRDRAATLEKYLLLEPGDLLRAGVTRLEPFHFIEVRLGKGIVRGAA